MGYGYVLPPHQGRDSVQDEVDQLQRMSPPNPAKNGRFLEPGKLSRKAQQMNARSQPPVPPSLHQAIDAEMTDAVPPPSYPVSYPRPPTDAPPPPPVEVTPITPLSGPCDAPVFVKFPPNTRALFACTLLGPHPGQPHMHQLTPIEQGDSIFLGWWHEGE